MNIADLKERLQDVLDKNNNAVITINGKWGVGKTYFWHQFKNNLTDKKTAYVSLFGKEAIAEIRTDIFLQVISKGKKAVKNVKNLVKSIKLPMIDVSTLITLLDKQDFEDIVVCFDDFERLSSSMKLEEILGFISELKEQKQCSVVMILNEDELNESDSKILSKYKEKIVDYEFNYTPMPSDSFAILQDRLTAFKDYPLEDYLIKHKINNIRVIGRIINALNDFYFIQPYIKDVIEVTTEVVGSIIEVAAINAQISSFDKLIQYASERPLPKFDKSDKFIKNEKHESLLSLIEGDDWNKTYFLQSDIASNLIKYCQTSLIDKKSFIEIVKLKVNDQCLYSVYNEITAKRDKHLYDMSYEVDEYVTDLWQLLQSKGNKIIIAGDTYLHPGNFIFTIEQLEQLDIENKEQYHNFAIKCLKNFIQNNLDWMQETGFGDPQKLLDFDKGLSDYYQQRIEENQQESITSVEQIIDLMYDVRKNRDWNNEPELLSQIQQKDIRQYILDSAKYVEEVNYFLHGNGATEQFSVYVDNTVSVLRELSRSENKNHARKAQDILEYLEKEQSIKPLDNNAI